MLLPIVLLVVIYLPFAMRSWRALFSLCIVYLAIEAGVRVGVATFSAADVPRFLVLAGNTWIDLLVKALPVTIVARAIVLAAKSLGLSAKRLVAANVVGILALPTVIFALPVYNQWERRPAPLQCTERQIPLVLSGFNGTAPWNKAISLHVGDDIENDGIYLVSSKHQRRVCRKTSAGTEVLELEAISVNPRNFSRDRCDRHDIEPWERYVCDHREDRWWRSFQGVAIFNPNGIRLGFFGIPRVVTNDNFPTNEDEVVVSVTDPNQGVVTAVCRKPTTPDRPRYCEMRRSLAEGVDLYWEASVHPDDLEDRILHTDAFAQSICRGFFEPSLCAGSNSNDIPSN